MKFNSADGCTAPSTLETIELYTLGEFYGMWIMSIEMFIFYNKQMLPPEVGPCRQ